MEQAIMLMIGFIGPLSLFGLIVMFYALYKEKKQRREGQKTATA